MADDRTLGQIAYEGYSEDSGGMSVITGDKLPDWEHAHPRVRQAWEAGARKVAERVTSDWHDEPELR